MTIFQDFLSAKEATSYCPACGKNNWTIPQDAPILAVPINQKDGFRIPPPSVAAHILVCGNCGFVRMHASAIVDPSTVKRDADDV